MELWFARITPAYLNAAVGMPNSDLWKALVMWHPLSLPCFQLLNCAEMATEIKPAPTPLSAFQRGICPRVRLLSQLQGWLEMEKERGLGRGN